MRCIFCLNPAPTTASRMSTCFRTQSGHTCCPVCVQSLQQPPRPFGRRNCNESYSHWHQEKALGIAGKSGTVPNPLERARLQADASHKVRFDFTKQSPESIYTIPFVQRTQIGAGQGNLSVRIDATDANRLGEIVNTALARAGAPPVSPETIEELKKNVVRQEQPRLSIPVSLDLGQYRRGLMKIVYELACLWMGESYLDDPMAALFRQFTLDESLPFDPSQRYPIRGTMRMAPKEPFFPFWPDELHHLMGWHAQPRRRWNLCIGSRRSGRICGRHRVTREVSSLPTAIHFDQSTNGRPAGVNLRGGGGPDLRPRKRGSSRGSWLARR